MNRNFLPGQSPEVNHEILGMLLGSPRHARETFELRSCPMTPQGVGCEELGTLTAAELSRFMETGLLPDRMEEMIDTFY